MKRNIWIVMSMVWLSELTMPEPARSDPNLELSVEADGSFHLHAKQAPLERIVESIRDETRTTLNYFELPNVITTVTCSGDIVELLNCALGDANNLMVEYSETSADHAGARIPEQIWILASTESVTPSLSSNEGPAGPCGALQALSSGLAQAGHALDDSGELDRLSRAESDALHKRMRSRDSATRIEAITRLRSVENATQAMDLLYEALSDQDPAVRAQAVSTLAARSAPDTDRILRQALLDPDAGVRLMAVDNATQDESLLLTALEDTDNNVRLVASMKLEEVNSQEHSNDP
ncbi:MAG: HEAT repeat domain-containing protein [Methylococcales bacterium]